MLLAVATSCKLAKTSPYGRIIAICICSTSTFETTGEMHFTPPVQTIYAARQGIKEYFEEGEAAKWARHQRVMAAIRQGIDRLGLKEALKREVQSGLVAAVRYPDDSAWDFEKVHDYCYERGLPSIPVRCRSRHV